MKLICGACSYLYSFPEGHRAKPGDTDAVCSEEPRGMLREPTRAEEIWIGRYRELHGEFLKQAGELREAMYPQERLAL